MTNHPNRSRRTRETPDPALIRQTRKEARLTQTAAGELCHRSERAWQQAEDGTRIMDSAAWELFLLRIGRHPTWYLVEREVIDAENDDPARSAGLYEPIL